MAATDSADADIAGAWIGTYPEAGPGTVAGRGESIWWLELDRRTGGLSAAPAHRAPAASFLATSPDGRVLYAVDESPVGAVSCFDVLGPDGLLPRWHTYTGGDGPCHLMLTRSGRTLCAANYGSGSLTVLHVGGVEPRRPRRVLASTGAGPVVGRQDGPHVHSSLESPDGTTLLVADLGADRVRLHPLATDGGVGEAAGEIPFPPGTGPRHLAFGPGDDLYVVGELSASLHVLRWDPSAGTAAHVARHDLGAGALTGGDDAPAHVVVVGRRLAVTVRGRDVIALFAIEDSGGRLMPLGDVRTGRTPRHCAYVPRTTAAGSDPDGWLVVAAQDDDEVRALRWTRDRLAPWGRSPAVTIPQAACVLPAPLSLTPGATL